MLRFQEKVLYIALYSFSVYFSNNIYGKTVLAIVLFTLFLKFSSNIGTSILSVLVICLSIYNSYFISFIYPILPKNKIPNLLFINVLLMRFIFENSYFLGINETVFFYYFWGIPIILMSFILTMTLKKYSSFILYIGAFLSLLHLYTFNQKINNSRHYTISSDNAVVANYTMLHNSFTNIDKLTISDLFSIKPGYFIFPISENKEIIKKNYITPNNIYLILAEHDNLNGFLENYPYFNSDTYYRMTPWQLYNPNYALPFKYVQNKDIFYSSNVGSTVKIGHPIIWDYTRWGKPIILASLANINKSKVFLWGDSDFLVSKLLPYNLTLAKKMSGHDFFEYYIFAILYLLSFSLNCVKKTYIKQVAYIIVCFTYFAKIFTFPSVKVILYSQVPFYSAHNEAHPSSFLNMLALDNIPSVISKKDSNILIISSKATLTKFPKTKIVYLLSGASFYTKEDKFICSDIKIGKEQNIIDSRLLIKNQELQKSGFYKDSNITIICTGSPQLNTKLIKDMLDEK